MRSSQEQRLKLEEARDELREVCETYGALFNSAQGRSVLADLEKQFGGSVIVPGDAYATHARAGSQEVLLYLKMMIEGDQHAISESEISPR